MRYVTGFFIAFCLMAMNVQGQVIDFAIPDTVCVNSPVTINNTSTGASSYYWSFCIADVNKTPDAVNLGNPGAALSGPVFTDQAFYNNNYYVFVCNNYPGGLVRLDFGNSMLNTPTAVSLGSVGGLIPNNLEGIQVVENEGKWYALLVAGDPAGGVPSRILKIEFGADLTNTNPVGTDWGNIGNLRYPIDLHVFKEAGNWYGFTVNSTNNTFTRFDFGSNFDNPPTGLNLGNIGSLDAPTGICAIKDQNDWYVFITNNAARSSITRLSFGSSLLNTPTAVNLGNVSNQLFQPRDIYLMKYCGKAVGFAVNGGAGKNDLVRLDFDNGIGGAPVAKSLGSMGGLNFPHSISKLFRVDNDLYSFITNIYGNSITRLKFAGCTNSSIPNSPLRDPAPVTYAVPGTYNINLTIDEGLPTQASLCRQVVVLNTNTTDFSYQLNDCSPLAVQFNGAITASPVTWDFGDGTTLSATGTPFHTYAAAGTYKVTYAIDDSRCGTLVMHDIDLKPIIYTDIIKTNDTVICAGTAAKILTDAGTGFCWFPSTYLDDPNSPNPVTKPLKDITYYLTLKGTDVYLQDSVRLTVSSPVVAATNDTILCPAASVHLTATGGVAYSWSPASGLSDPAMPDPVASPSVSTKYTVKGLDSYGCPAFDSVLVTVRKEPVFGVARDAYTACVDEPIQLLAFGGNKYRWSPAAGLSGTAIANPVLKLKSSDTYTVKITDSVCGKTGDFVIPVTINPAPTATIFKSNDITCNTPFSQLSTDVTGISYRWSPAEGLNNPFIANPLASPGKDITYQLSVVDNNGCISKGTIDLGVKSNNDFRLYQLPTGFTPDNDGKNDCFGIRKWGNVQIVYFKIFNRWGNLVFSGSNSNPCWDGTFEGVIQPAGNFVYKIMVETLCGIVERKGSVFLIR